MSKEIFYKRKNTVSINLGFTNNPFFQPKLTINQPNDVFEQEADAVADHILQSKSQQRGSELFFKPMNISSVQRKCTHCEEEEKKKAQRKEMNGDATTADSTLENYVGGLNCSGQPLSKKVRSFFEPRIGYDFSNVKVHTDSVAAKSAQSINALAYTSGNNIVFNSGQYAPNSDSGKKLLGHELTHVVQQSTGVVRRYGHDKHCSTKDHLEPFIWTGHPAAVTMLENIIAAFAAGDGRIKKWASQFFGKDALLHLSEIEAGYKSILSAVEEEYMYHCNDSSNKNDNAKKCVGQRAETDLDWHLIGGGNKDITLCFDVINSSWTARDMGALIIHENWHRAFGKSSHPWSVSGNPPNCANNGGAVSSTLLLDNPDSYACMATVF